MVDAQRRPYFFLSYARTPKHDPGERDDPDRWVHKLYRDLCAEILQMTSCEPEEAGFMDRENELGAEWSRKLLGALSSCRVFVPLYSPRYFESDNCGREWLAFARRELNHRARADQPVSAIVPALWTTMTRDLIPEVAQHIQYDHVDLGQRYLAEGFYGIMKLSSYRHDYQRAVHWLARRIIEVAEATNVRPDEPDLAIPFGTLEKSFGRTSARRTVNSQLHIAVVAHSISSLPPGRAKEYYGDTPQGWRPYWPDYQQPLTEYASEVARKCLDCQPVVTALQSGYDLLSGTPPGPALCLVDAWTVLSDTHRDLLRGLNEVRASWVTVVVPWNHRDPELADAADDLRRQLSDLLGDRFLGVPRQCQLASAGVPTLLELGQILPQIMMIMMKRFLKGAQAYPPPGPKIERPRLRDLGSKDSGGAG